MAQGHERPGSGAITFPVRRAAGFSQDTVALGDRIGRKQTTPMARHDGGKAMLIEARDQVGDSIAGAAASSLGGSSVGLAGSNSEERFGTGNVASGFRV